MIAATTIWAKHLQQLFHHSLLQGLWRKFIEVCKVVQNNIYCSVVHSLSAYTLWASKHLTQSMLQRSSITVDTKLSNTRSLIVWLLCYPKSQTMLMQQLHVCTVCVSICSSHYAFKGYVFTWIFYGYMSNDQYLMCGLRSLGFGLCIIVFQVFVTSDYFFWWV